MSEQVFIFDTTLRDGEQSPGNTMNTQEKLRVARQLELLGVDIIEAGFPIASEGDFDAVKQIAKLVKNCQIAGLARANDEDIDRAWKAIKVAAHPRIHTFISTSDIHLKHQFRKTRDEVLEIAVAAVKRAKRYTDNVEFSAMDATRSDWDYLCKVVAEVIDAGATTVNIPDTVGYAVPHEFGELIAYIRKNVPNIDKAIISVHCHNDLGLATANSIAAIHNGARQVECTINGIGERAGNASLEEIAMTLRTRKTSFTADTRIVSEKIYPTSRLITSITGVPVQPNKAIVGANAFAHESGIHVDGILKERTTYEIMTPETIGLSGSRMVLGRHSGRHGFADRCESLGYKLSKEEIDAAYEKFLEIADKKKEVFDEDIAAIITDEVRAVEHTYTLEYLHVACGTGTLPTASVKVRIGDKVVQAAACGDGPVDAAYEAIRQATSLCPKIENYSIRALTGGKEALGEATVRVRGEKRSFIGRGVSTDIIEASAKAYVDAINRMAAMENNGSNETRAGL